MKVAIAMPVCVQVKVLEEMTLRCLSLIKSTHDVRVYLTMVREPKHDAERFKLGLRTGFTLPIVYRTVDCCVGAAWNWGWREAIDWADYLMILANDVELEPGTIDALVAFGEGHPEATMWSGVAKNLHPEVNAWANTDGCDFSCCMTRPLHFLEHGEFDENFKPAYHEDNDYAARVILGGGTLTQTGSAKYIHRGSTTIHNDAEMNHHSSYWWPKHERYFKAKWGVCPPLNAPEDIRKNYFKTPFNAPGRSLSWWQTNMIDPM